MSALVINAKNRERDGDDFLGQVVVPLVEFNLPADAHRPRAMDEAGCVRAAPRLLPAIAPVAGVQAVCGLTRAVGGPLVVPTRAWFARVSPGTGSP